MLDEETTNRFRAELRKHCADPVRADEGLRDAVGATAAEARTKGMTAARFVIWVKKIWDEIVDEGGLDYSIDPGRERDVVISAAIKAYYVQ